MYRKFFIVTLLIGLFLLLSTATVAQVRPADSWIRSALSSIKRYEAKANNLTPGNRRKIKDTIRYLSTPERKLSRSRNKGHQSWKDANKRLQKLKKRLQDLLRSSKNAPSTAPLSGGDKSKIAKIKRMLKNRIRQLDRARTQDLIKSSEQKFWRRTVRTMRRVHRVVRDKNHSQVKGILARINSYADRVEKRLKAAGKAGEELRKKYGDIDVFMAKLKERYQSKENYIRPIDHKRGELTVARIEKWVDRTLMQKALHKDDARAMTEIKNNHPKGKKSDVVRLERFMRIEVPRNLKKAISKTDDRFGWRLKARRKRSVVWIRALDPKNPGHVSNRFKPELMDRVLDQARKGIEEAKAIQIFDEKLMGRPGNYRRALIAEFEAASKSLIRKAVRAIAGVRMPRSAGGGRRLAGLARRTLAKKKYGVNPISRLVVNSGLEKKSRTKWDSLRKRWVRFRWQEFQVATAERIGNRYFIFYNNLRKYRSGFRTTPTGRWLLNSRFQGQQILKKNIRK